MTIDCEYREQNSDDVPVCQVVAELTELPLAVCRTNDSACRFCLNCGVAPQQPNEVVASMAIHATVRSGQPPGPAVARFKGHISQGAPPEITLENMPCVLRGPQTREVPCKPCQAGSLTVVNAPAYRCPKHGECTLKNTGVFPKIQACTTCEDRLPEYPKLVPLVNPPSVLQAMRMKN